MSAQKPFAKRPRLALPYTILAAPDTVRLVAGEEFRYTLQAPNLQSWLPNLLERLNGKLTLDELLHTLDAPNRTAASEILQRLYSERVLEDSPAEIAHQPTPHRLQIEGSGALFERLQKFAASLPADAKTLRILCQDRLDYSAALSFNAGCLRGNEPWLWITSGPLTRAYVSPVFLPDAGPCLQCLLSHFQRISPAPEIYRHLIEHAAEGKPIAPAELPTLAIDMLEALIKWKSEQLNAPDAPAALYRLHVLELVTMEIQSYPLTRDPECPACCIGVAALLPPNESPTDRRRQECRRS